MNPTPIIATFTVFKGVSPFSMNSREQAEWLFPGEDD
jgi:hypothetical protein